MGKSGVIISAFYSMILLLFIIPGIFLLSAESSYPLAHSFLADLVKLYKQSLRSVQIARFAKLLKAATRSHVPALPESARLHLWSEKRDVH